MPDAVVRCKFRLTKVLTSESQSSVKQEDGTYKYTPAKMYDLHFVPVTGTYDQKLGRYTDSENTRFWSATPSGEFKFSTISETAARAFEFGRDYYVDFSPAPGAGEDPTKTAPGA